MKKILVLPLYGIGDVLVTTPALRNLKEQMDARITYLHMFKTTRDILLNNPYVDENIHFPFLDSSRMEGLRFLMRFRKRFDCTINFYPSNRRDYNLAALVVGSRVRIGHRYREDDIKEMNFLKTYTIMEEEDFHCVEENLRLLDFLGLGVKNPYPMEIFLSDGEGLQALAWLRERNITEKVLVGFHAGASTFKNHGMKRWPAASFAGLIDGLYKEDPDRAFLLFGGPEEKPVRDKILEMVRHGRNVFSVDSASIRFAASLMTKCRLFVSNDSGPMHMAAASGVPVVAIFGPTNPVWVRPWGVGHRIVRTGAACSPCFRYSPRPMVCGAGLDFACLSDLGVDQVLKACEDLINDTRN